MDRWALISDGFVGLARWARRRPTGLDEFTYHRRSQLIAFLVVLVVTLPVEVLLLELLVPWDPVRWVLLAVAIVGSLWAIGVILSVRTFPHRLLDVALEARYGALGRALVPYEQIRSVNLAHGKPPRGEGVFVDSTTETAWVAAGGQTQVTIQLRQPITVWDGFARRGPVRTLHLAADDPEAMAAALRSRLEAG
jgi:hypothetical protein